MIRDQVDLLLVEDSPDYAAFVSQTLQKSNYFSYSITHASTLSDARHELSRREFDIVILDLVLPNGEGTDLVKEIRQLAPRKRTAIIVVASAENEENEIAIRRQLVNDYVCRDELPIETFSDPLKRSRSEEIWLTMVRNWAIFAVGVREARKATSGLESVSKQMDETIETCELSKNLPPYKKDE